MNSTRDNVVFYLNGVRHDVRGDQAIAPVSDYLRYARRLTGTKIVCAEGDCGACTLLLARPTGDRPWRFEPVNSCVIATAQLDGAHLLTIEAVADGTAAHEVQRAMTECHGSQCGFCTPGFVMAMLGHFEHHADDVDFASEKSIKNHLTGNLCRCTGYLPIVEAGRSVKPGVSPRLTERYHSDAIVSELERATAASLTITAERGTLYAPRSLQQLLSLRAEHPSARLIAGNTDLGVLFNKGKWWPAGDRCEAISLNGVHELARSEVSSTHITVGALVTLGELERLCTTRVDELALMLRVFASPQIKSMATLVGNIANGSPIGDTIPALFALNAELELMSTKGSRWIPISDYYLGYKQFALRADELIARVRFERPAHNQLFRSYKVCQRKDLDISFVSSAYRLTLDRETITHAQVVYGGVGPTVLALRAVEAQLVGQSLTDVSAMEHIAQAIEQQVAPRTDVRGSDQARRILAGNLFRRFVHQCTQSTARLPATGAEHEVSS
jgi:xanthine dehydrogenase small subunit